MKVELMKHINKNFAIGGRILSVREPDWNIVKKGVRAYDHKTPY